MRELERLSLLVTIFLACAVFMFSLVTGRLLAFGQQRRAPLVFLFFILILGLLSLFFLPRAARYEFKQMGSLPGYLLVAVFGFGGAAVAYWSYTSAPPFIIKTLSITAKVQDVAGTSGHIEGRIDTEALKNELYDIVWGNLGSTGMIRNVTFRALDVEYSSDIKTLGGQVQATLKFAKPLKRRQSARLVLEYDIVGSQPEDKVYWVHSVTWPTENLQVNLIVPKERPCRSTDARSENAVQMGTDLKNETPPLFVSDDKTKLTWLKSYPQTNRSYVVTCYW